MEIREESRENWGTRAGFILAAVGSAVGLGNLWGFPYKLYSFGGGAFLIPYVFALIAIGIPMMILEFSLGHITQRAAPDAFGRLNRKFEVVGWWAIILSFVIMTYYPVILAYCFSFLWYSLKGAFLKQALPWAGAGIEGVKNANDFFYNQFLGYHQDLTLGALQPSLILPLALTWLAAYLCTFKGTKHVGRVVLLTVPLPWIMLLILTVRGMTLPGSAHGLAFYLNPDWSELAEPTTWRYAFGQVFFSLSLAFGVMITYASFLHRKSDLNNNAAIVGLADLATSFIAGLAVFSTLGAMSFASQQAGNPIPVTEVVAGGPGLTFVAFPYALAQLPAAPWFSILFFVTLVTLGIDSAFSISESVLAAIVDKTGWKRSIVLPSIMLIGFLIGLVFITQGGLNWLGIIDGFINGTWGIAFIGCLECLILGWLYRIDRLRLHANDRSDWTLGRWWTFIIRLFIPLVLGTLVVWSLFDDITNKDGFLMTPDHKWKIGNVVGMIVVTLAPIIALVISVVPNLRKTEHLKQHESEAPSTGTIPFFAGITSATLSAITFVILALSVKHGYSIEPKQIKILISASAILSIGAITLSWTGIRKTRSEPLEPSWPTRAAGLFGTIALAGSFGSLLAMITSTMETQTSEQITQKTAENTLSAGGYVSLGIITLLLVAGLSWCLYRALGADTRRQK